MDIYVLGSDFNRLALIDDYESCIWNVKYYEAGDFELYLPASCNNIRVLQRNRYLVRDKDVVAGCMYNVMVIEKVETQTDIEFGDHLIVTGRGLKSIVGRRIIWTQTNLSGRVEVELRRLLSENIINPSIMERKMDNVILGDLKGYTETIKQQVTGDNLLEYIESVLTTYGIGWRCCVNENRKIKFDFYKGVDRSVDQSTYPRVVFSPDNENILNSDYSMDYSNYKNVALVAGEGEGTARKRTTVGTNCTGLNRYELYVDARDVSSNDGEISDAEYMNDLKANGQETLNEYKRVESFEGEIETQGVYIYGEDYDIGDVVTVTNIYEVTANPRIIGVIESYSELGESVIPTFSSWIDVE